MERRPCGPLSGATDPPGFVCTGIQGLFESDLCQLCQVLLGDSCISVAEFAASMCAPSCTCGLSRERMRISINIATDPKPFDKHPWRSPLYIPPPATHVRFTSCPTASTTRSLRDTSRPYYTTHELRHERRLNVSQARSNTDSVLRWDNKPLRRRRKWK